MGSVLLPLYGLSVHLCLKLHPVDWAVDGTWDFFLQWGFKDRQMECLLFWLPNLLAYC